MKRIFFTFIVLFAIVCIADIRIDGGGAGAGGPETDPIAGPALSTHAALSKAVHSIADTSKLLTSESDPVAGPALSTHAGLTKAVHGISDTSKLLTSESDPNSLHTNGDNSMTGDITCLTDGSCDIGSKDSGTTKLRPANLWATTSVNVGDTTEITDQQIWIGKEIGETGTLRLGPEGTKLEHELGGDPRVVRLTLGSPGHAEFQIGQIGQYWGLSPSLNRWMFQNPNVNMIFDNPGGAGVDSQFKFSMYNPPHSQSLTWGFAAPWDGVAYRWVISTSEGDLNLVPSMGDGAVNINKYTGKTGTINLGSLGASISADESARYTFNTVSDWTYPYRFNISGVTKFEIGPNYGGFLTTAFANDFTSNTDDMYSIGYTNYGSGYTRYRHRDAYLSRSVRIADKSTDSWDGELYLGKGTAKIAGNTSGALTLTPASGQTTTVHGFVEEIERHLESVGNKTYVLVQKARFARQVDKVVILCSAGSGTISADLKIDGTAIDGCNTISVTDTEQDVSCTNNATNDLAAAATLTLVTSSNSSCGDLIVGVQTTRD